MKRQAHDRQFVLARVADAVGVGAIAARASIARMHMSDRRAYARVAAQCLRVSVLTVDRARYFCAPAVRVETATAMAAVLHLPQPETQLWCRPPIQEVVIRCFPLRGGFAGYGHE